MLTRLSHAERLAEQKKIRKQLRIAKAIKAKRVFCTWYGGVYLVLEWNWHSTTALLQSLETAERYFHHVAESALEIQPARQARETRKSLACCRHCGQVLP
jgi:hypothetical protein